MTLILLLSFRTGRFDRLANGLLWQVYRQRRYDDGVWWRPSRWQWQWRRYRRWLKRMSNQLSIWIMQNKLRVGWFLWAMSNQSNSIRVLRCTMAFKHSAQLLSHLITQCSTTHPYRITQTNSSNGPQHFQPRSKPEPIRFDLLCMHAIQSDVWVNNPN